MATQGLSVRELFAQVFDMLKENLSGEVIKLPYRAFAEIANDSDWHRTRVGGMCYESTVLVRMNGKRWALAFGTATGYPADPYNCDIIAVEVSQYGDGIDGATLSCELEKSTYFKNTLIFAKADGTLFAPKNGFERRMFKALEKVDLSGFLARAPEIDPEHMTMDLRPVVTAVARYKKEFVSFLSKLLQEVLMSASQ